MKFLNTILRDIKHIKHTYELMFEEILKERQHILQLPAVD